MADEPLNGAVFVAIGEDGLRMFSRDGREWINRTTGKEGEVFANVCFGEGRCLVSGRYGGDNIFAITNDGSQWQPAKHDARYANYVRSLVYFRKQFLGFGTTFVMTSTDGVKWEKEKTITEYKAANNLGGNLRRFAMGNELLLAVGDFGRISISSDGPTLQNAPDTKAVNTLIDVAFGNGVFVGGGMHGLRMRSADGLTWTDRVLGEEGEHINNMVWDGKRFVGIGQGATYTSPDGLAWERIPNENAPTAAAFGNGNYVGSLYPGRVLHSTDGIHWEEVLKLPQHVLNFAWGELGSR